MPSRFCPYCRAVVPAEEFDRHKRQVHMRRRLSKAQKQAVKARDGHKCVRCGATERLEVHHIDDDPRNDAMDNLETRCPGCNPRGATYQYVDDDTRHRP